MVWHRGMKKKYKKLLDITYINYESLNTDFLTETVWLSHIQIYQRIQNAFLHNIKVLQKPWKDWSWNSFL